VTEAKGVRNLVEPGPVSRRRRGAPGQGAPVDGAALDEIHAELATRHAGDPEAWRSEKRWARRSFKALYHQRCATGARHRINPKKGGGRCKGYGRQFLARMAEGRPRTTMEPGDGFAFHRQAFSVYDQLCRMPRADC